jgi:hypothetical protein
MSVARPTTDPAGRLVERLVIAIVLAFSPILIIGMCIGVLCAAALAKVSSSCRSFLACLCRGG